MGKSQMKLRDKATESFELKDEHFLFLASGSFSAEACVGGALSYM